VDTDNAVLKIIFQSKEANLKLIKIFNLFADTELVETLRNISTRRLSLVFATMHWEYITYMESFIISFLSRPNDCSKQSIKPLLIDEYQTKILHCIKVHLLFLRHTIKY